MQRYTVYGDLVDKKIDKKLNVFLDTLKTTSLWSCIEAIFLTGSYARGCGSVRMLNNKPIDASSDFDVYIITNCKIKHSDFVHFFKEISEKAKFAKENFMIDLHYSTKANLLNVSDLPKLFPIFRFYNIKYYSKLVYGNDVRNRIPDFLPSDLPVYEGLRLILNRLFEIADTFDISLFTNQKISHEGKLKLSKEICKSYVFSLHAFMILLGEFSYDYKKNLKKIESSRLYIYLSEKIPDYKTKIMSSVKQLRTSKFDLDKCQDRWEEAMIDLLVMIDVYFRVAYGVRETDSALNKLKKVSRLHLGSYLRWKIYSGFGININPNSVLVMVGCKVYQLIENIKYFLTFNYQIPYYNKIAIDPGLKIYWMGIVAFKKLMESKNKGLVSGDVGRFSEIFNHYFKKRADRREIFFGDRKKAEPIG